MAKKIRSVSQLPDWFHLKKYNAAKHLTLAGWIEQFIVRFDLWMRIHGGAREDRQVRRTGKTTAEVMRALPEIRANPIVNIMGNDLLKECFYETLREFIADPSVYSGGVHLTTAREMYTMEQTIDPAKRLEAHRYFAQASDVKDVPTDPFGLPSLGWLDKSVDDLHRLATPNIHLSVNLWVSPKILALYVKQLVAFHQSSMEEMGMSIPKWRKRDFSRWIRARVLPFMDLMQWAKENDVDIPYQVMADAFFPESEKGGEAVGKTTKKYANELLNYSRLKTMAAEVTYKKAK